METSLRSVRGYPWLLAAMTLARVANAMSQVSVVIYLLDRTGSPAIAGAGAAAQLVPGVLSGPFVGAWLDRAELRRRLIVSAQVLRGLLLLAVVAIGATDPPAAVYLIVLAGLGLTFPIANVGFRSLVPAMVPEPLWNRANAADSVSFDAAFVLGPALAGIAVSTLGSADTIVLQALVTLASGAAAARLVEPRRTARVSESPLRAVATGFSVVWGHRGLRASTALMVVSGLGYGCLLIGLPLWATDTLGVNAGLTGWLWAALSAGSVLGGLAYGWRRPRGSDGRHLVGFAILSGLPLLVLPECRTLGQGVAVMFAAGLVMAPFIIAMFSIRQRSVGHELHGRVFAITVSINAAAAPAGAFLAGALVRTTGIHRLLYGAGVGQIAAAVLAAVVLGQGRRHPQRRNA